MVVLEHKSGYRLGAEESQVAAALDELGGPYQIASLSQVKRGRVSTVEASLVVGTIPFVQAALRQKGRSLQAEQTYPHCPEPPDAPPVPPHDAQGRPGTVRSARRIDVRQAGSQGQTLHLASVVF